MKGATIMPGIVDVHAHWIEIARGELDLQSWAFMANLAYGVTTRPRSADQHERHVRLSGPDRHGRNARAARLQHRPRHFLDHRFSEPRRGPQRGHALQEVLPDQYREVVHGRQSQAARVDGDGLQGKRHHADHRRRSRSEAGSHARPRRLFAATNIRLPIVPLYKDVVEIFARSGIFYTPTLLVAYGGPWAENYFYETTEVHDDAKLQRFIPHDILDRARKRRPWFSRRRAGVSEAGRSRRRRSSTPAAASASADTARSRASSATGRCGRSRAAA